uniref:Uncharacterized protein n=1 Tax=Populus trichocarpa TaxID=3694 RepID=A0A2K1R847_POPTR
MKGRGAGDQKKKERAGRVGELAKRRGATRGLPRRSPILILLSPKHVSLWSSDGIPCISAGMIAPVSPCTCNSYKRFEGVREEDRRVMAGVAAVRAPPAWGSATGTLERASSLHVRTLAQKGHNPSDCAQIFTGASGVRFPYSSMESLHRPPDL